MRLVTLHIENLLDTEDYVKYWGKGGTEERNILYMRHNPYPQGSIVSLGNLD